MYFPQLHIAFKIILCTKLGQTAGNTEVTVSSITESTTATPGPAPTACWFIHRQLFVPVRVPEGSQNSLFISLFTSVGQHHSFNLISESEPKRKQ